MNSDAAIATGVAGVHRSLHSLRPPLSSCSYSKLTLIMTRVAVDPYIVTREEKPDLESSKFSFQIRFASTREVEWTKRSVFRELLTITGLL
jgi:hypothetical protein